MNLSTIGSLGNFISWKQFSPIFFMLCLMIFCSTQTNIAQEKSMSEQSTFKERIKFRPNTKSRTNSPSNLSLIKSNAGLRGIMGNYIDTFPSDPIAPGQNNDFSTARLSYQMTQDGGDFWWDYYSAGQFVMMCVNTQNAATEAFKITSSDGKAFVFNSFYLDLYTTNSMTVTGTGPEPFTFTKTASGTYSPTGGSKLVTQVEVSSSDFWQDGLDNVNVELDVPGAALYGNNVLIINGDDSPTTTDYTDFGSTSSGNPISRTFTIKNLGGATLTITTPLTISGTGYSITSQPSSSSIAVGGSTTFTVQFDPTGSGTFNGQITIINNSEANPYTFSITGTGTGAPEIDIKGNGVSIGAGDASPSTTDDTDFGSLNVSSGSVEKTFTIYNTGNASLSLTDASPYVTITGHTSDFTLTQTPSGSIAASGSTTFKVTFNPTTTGIRSASISIANNDSNENPYTFDIQGTGIAAPAVTTTAASSIAATSATLGGNASSDNGVSITERGVVYSTTDTTPTIGEGGVTQETNGSGTGIFSESIGSLSQGATYYFQAYAKNTEGTSYGGVENFTTLDVPSAATNDATSVLSDGATLNGTVNAKGASTTVTFEYGTTTSYGTSVTANQSPVTGSTNTSVSKAITGLTPNTTYHYRVIGVNSIGTTNGTDKTFTSTAIVPAATTNDASSLASDGATLNGTVNANNASTTITFEYGLTTGYGTTVSADQSPVTGTSNTSVSKAVTGLTPNTTYHYRVVGDNTAGTTNGADKTFSTTALPPVATTNAASGIASDGATLNGTINPNNASTTVTFEFGLDTNYGTSVTAAESPVTGTGNISVSKAISSLTPNTTYHYRVVGVNSGGTTNGSDLTFTTSAVVPTAATNSASSVSSSGATLNGTVNANNASSAVTFEYGLTTAYGSTITADESPVAGLTNTSVSKTISGLSENTTYHYRVVAQNAAGTTYGADITFLTDYSTPSNQANSILFSNVGPASMKIDWTSGSGLNRAVFIKEGNSGSASPVNNNTYTANIKFGSGTQIGATGWYCIYNNNGSGVTIDGLIPGTTYQVSVIEYNGTSGREQYYTAAAADNPANATTKNILINELDANTVSTDDAEFIELYDGGTGNVPLDGLVLILFNGNDDLSYRAIDLDGKATDANGYLLIGNSGVTGVDITFPNNTLQNGADAVALYVGSDGDFPNGTVVTTTNLVDALVYDNDDADDAGLLVLLNGGEQQVNENLRNDSDNHSLQRIPNGSGGLRNTSTYVADWPTPKVANETSPEINLKGNGNSIADGDTTPSATDDTDFGNVDVGSTSTHTFTIENSGLASLTISGVSPYVILSGDNADQFSVSSAPSNSVGIGTNTTFDINFSPTSAGTKTAVVTINNDDDNEGTYDFKISGVGIVPEINVKQGVTDIADGSGSYDFGNKNVGTDTDITFTVENTGAGSLTLSTITLGGANADQFNVRQDPSSPVAGSGSTTFIIRFTPTTYGLKTATISFTHNDADENPYDFTITGTGLEPEIAVKEGANDIPDGTGTYDFGAKLIGESKETTFTIDNIGNSNLTLGTVTLGGVNADQFSIQLQPATPVGGGSSTTFKIKFTPTAVGAKTATVQFNNNDGNENPFDFTITGSASSPEINIKEGVNNIANGGSFDFGNKKRRTSTDIVFTIENIGSSNLNLGGVPIITITGADAGLFNVQAQPATPIAPANSTTFTIRFSPTTLGAKTASISIASDDQDENPFTITLNGTGTNNPPVLSGIEATPLLYSENSGAKVITSTLTLTDIDDNNMTGAVIQITGNYKEEEDVLEFTNSANITGTWENAAGKMTLNGIDTKANYESALREVKYKNTSENPTTNIKTAESQKVDRQINESPRTLSFSVNDGNDNSNIQTRTIDIAKQNDPPVLEINTGLTVKDGESKTIDKNMLKANDVDNEAYSIRYYITEGPYHGKLLVDGNILNAFRQNEINLEMLVYQHNGSKDSADSFKFYLEDNEGGISQSYTFIITINTQNDPPLLFNIEANPLEYIVNTQPVKVTSTIDVNDSDDAVLAEAVIKIENYSKNKDFLAFENANGITHTFELETGTLTLTGDANLTAYRDALRSVEFLSVADATTIGIPRNIAFTVSDGEALSNSLSRTVNIVLPTEANPDLAPPSEISVRFLRNKTIQVNWTDNSEGESGFIVYRTIVLSENRLSTIFSYEPVGIVGENIVEYNDTNVEEGVNYYYKVYAFNSGGYASSDENEGQLLETLAPPSDLTVNIVNEDQVGLNWLDNSEMETSYIVERDDGLGYSQIVQVDANTTTYTDNGLSDGWHYYRVKACNNTCSSAYSDVAEIFVGAMDVNHFGDEIPTDFVLTQNYPNPFNPVTTIRYGIPETANVRITVYNILGQEVITLINMIQTAGYYEAAFEGSSLNSGVYLYKIQAGNFIEIKKMVLLK